MGKLLKEFQARFHLNSKKSKKLGFSWKIEPILHARVPIIKLTGKHTSSPNKIYIDIGVRSTQMPITKLINYYLDYDEKVCIFMMFIKQWSKVRQISDAIHGFPNSFGFVMLCIKFLQLLSEPIIPIMDYDKNKKKIIERHSIRNFKPNEMTLLELAVCFFDYYFNFDFEAYQISITSCGLDWKHEHDYNLSHSDQSTMLVEDPSSKNENVTRCLKPYNLKVIRTELFRGYKCAKNADWDLLFKPYDQGLEPSIFEKYPPIDKNEVDIQYELEELDEDINAVYEDYHHAKAKKKAAKKLKYKKKSKKGPVIIKSVIKNKKVHATAKGMFVKKKAS